MKAAVISEIIRGVERTPGYVASVLAEAKSEKRAQDRRVLTDRVRAVESLAREARESMIQGCDEVQDGLSYLAAFNAIELLAGAILKDSPKE
jgi:hypothetical protein